MKRRASPPASPTRQERTRDYAASSSRKASASYAPTSLASELSKHKKAREIRDAQKAAKLRHSQSKHDDVVRIKREHISPELRRSMEPISAKEPEYSRKERLLDARDSNIVVKVENVQHNHRSIPQRTPDERPMDSPKKLPPEKLPEKPYFNDAKLPQMAPAKDSPYENVSDVEPSPAFR